MHGQMGRLENARRRYDGHFDSTCTIMREGDVVHADVPCTIEILPDDQSQVLERQNVPVSAFRICIPYGYDLRTGDYVAEKGRVLEVILPDLLHSYQLRREARAIEIRPVA